MRMPFGKFKGVEVPDLPDDYLAWLHDNVELRAPLNTAVNTEYEFRFNATSATKPLSDQARQMATEIISAGFRKLALQHHPDHGGETTTMQLINEAADFLRHIARTA